MSIYTFFKTLAITTAIALIAFAFLGDGLLFLAKGLALALALSIGVTLALPRLRGIKKGDKVSIVGGTAPILPFMLRTGIALTGGTINKQIRVKLEDGKEVLGVIESYDGFFPPFPARVRIIYEERMTG